MTSTHTDKPDSVTSDYTRSDDVVNTPQTDVIKQDNNVNLHSNNLDCHTLRPLLIKNGVKSSADLEAMPT